MTHRDLTDRFWRLDSECQFTSNETRIYLQLLDAFSRVGFDRTITMSDTLAIGLFGISLKAYRAARKRLVDRGLITIEICTVKRRRSTTFSLTGELPPQKETEPETESDLSAPQEPVQTPKPQPEAKPKKPVAIPVPTARRAKARTKRRATSRTIPIRTLLHSSTRHRKP